MAGTFVLTDTITKTFDDLFADVNDGHRRRRARGGRLRRRVRRRPAGPRRRDARRRRWPSADGVAAAEGPGPRLRPVRRHGRRGHRRPRPRARPPSASTGPTIRELNPFTLVDGEPPGPDEVVIDQPHRRPRRLRGRRRRAGPHPGRRGRPCRSPASPASATPTARPAPPRALFDTADRPGAGRHARQVRHDLRGRRGRRHPGAAGREHRGRCCPSDQDLEVLTGAEFTEDQQDQIKEVLGFFNTFLLVFAVIALFVGAFIIYNTFSIIVAQRTRELALLRAVGASRRQVLGRRCWSRRSSSASSPRLVGLVVGIGLAELLKAGLDAIGFELPATGAVVLPRTVMVCVRRRRRRHRGLGPRPRPCGPRGSRPSPPCATSPSTTSGQLHPPPRHRPAHHRPRRAAPRLGGLFGGGDNAARQPSALGRGPRLHRRHRARPRPRRPVRQGARLARSPASGASPGTWPARTRCATPSAPPPPPPR